MAGSRAAASVSLTIGVAFATLLVAGGILTGPAILECSHQSASLGACLRARAAEAGLVHDAAGPPADSPVASTDLPAPLMAPEPQRPQGWLEANANEYEAPLSTGSALLTAPLGTVGAGGLTPRPMLQGSADIRAPAGAVTAAGKTLPAPDAAAQIALAQPPGRLAAGGQSPRAAQDGAPIALEQPAGHLAASAAIVAHPDGAVVDLSAEPANVSATGAARPGTPDTTAQVAMLPPAGRIAVEGLGRPGAGASAFADPAAPGGAVAITGSMSSAAARHGAVALEAEAEMPPALPAPLTTAPPLPTPTPSVRPKPPTAAIMASPKNGSAGVPKADPRYPNVLVLPPPPPIAGPNSSFATLQIR